MTTLIRRRGLGLVALLAVVCPLLLPATPVPLPPVGGPSTVEAAAPAGTVYTGVRLTYYTAPGTMYSGAQTFEGAAATHLGWLPIGTRFTLDCIPGQVYTVLDTGTMPPNWVDLFVRSPATGKWLYAMCGDYVTVRVVDAAIAPAAPVAPAAAPAPDSSLEAALTESLRSYFAARGVSGVPPFAVKVLARAGDWVKALVVPQVAGVERAAVYFRQTPDGWQVAAGPGHAFDPASLRALGVPDALIAE